MCGFVKPLSTSMCWLSCHCSIIIYSQVPICKITVNNCEACDKGVPSCTHWQYLWYCTIITQKWAVPYQSCIVVFVVYYINWTAFPLISLLCTDMLCIAHCSIGWWLLLYRRFAEEINLFMCTTNRLLHICLSSLLPLDRNQSNSIMMGWWQMPLQLLSAK